MAVSNMPKISSNCIGIVIVLMFVRLSLGQQCQWNTDSQDLQLQCICGSGGNLRLTVQCGSVELKDLVSALQLQKPLDLLAIVNGSISTLEDSSFSGLDVRSIQLSSVKIQSVSNSAFQGLERLLTSLNLEQNELRKIPSLALRRLSQLKELDLSRNRISEIEDGEFFGLGLTTLKLADNPLVIRDGAFRGLENTLHNLNLKGADQDHLPPALQSLSELSFLDLSQNKLIELSSRAFVNLRQLTALTLERNHINSVDDRAFEGLNATLSSLSLLNNRIETFPLKAIESLTQLRVLDLGFNRIHEIPINAFLGNHLLSLLALDGNPLITVSENVFTHLNSTLRGLSIGGATLICDCRLKWILQWVKRNSLQVTSRERNPQFCGRPIQLRRRTLPQLSINELQCEEQFFPKTSPTSQATTEKTTLVTQSTRSPLLLAGARDLRAPRTALGQLRLLETSREGDNVTIKWDSIGEALRSRTAPPVHAMYRVFGEPHFHLGSSISPLLGWVRIRVPEGKPVVVCVVESAQAATLSPEAVPHSQCHEVAPDKVSDTQLNKIIIGSSAAVCGMIIIAVIIFVCCSKKARRDPLSRPTVKSDHEWENASLYSTRSIPRVRTYHGSVNPNFLHEARTPDDVQSFRSLPPPRIVRGPVLNNKDLHNSHIALSQLSGHHSFLGAAYDNHHNNWNNHHWDNGDIYSESRHIPSRLSYAKDSSFG